MHDQATIFYFEDNPKWIKHFGDFLTNQDYRVEHYADYASAIKAASDPFRDSPPNIALIDLNAPEHGDNTGIYIIEALRKRYGCKLPIVVLSVYDDPLYRKKALEALTNWYITKGEAEDKEYLLAVIKNLILLNNETIEGNIIDRGDLKHFQDKNLYYWKGKPVKLSRKEKDIVYCLMNKPSVINSFEQIRQFARLKKTSIDDAREDLDLKMEKIEYRLEQNDLSEEQNQQLNRKYMQYAKWLDTGLVQYIAKLDQNLISKHISSIRKAFQAVDEDFSIIISEHNEGYYWDFDPNK